MTTRARILVTTLTCAALGALPLVALADGEEPGGAREGGASSGASEGASSDSSEGASESAASDGGDPRAPAEPPPPSRYRNPTGSFVVGLSVGVAVGGGRTAVAVGGGVGYAVVTGVVPGLRGLVIFDEKLGGEVALNLTLTPPLDFYLVPFVLGEVGRRWDGVGSAWMYAGGGGLYVGEPDSALGLQVGWMFRRYVYEAVEADGSGLMLALSIRL